MSVYVDRSVYPYGRMMMCHMIADTLEELHDMADKIGVARRWFQNKGFPHYDICKSMRAKAVAAGAVEVSNRELVDVMRRFKERASAGRTSQEGSGSQAAPDRCQPGHGSP